MDQNVPSNDTSKTQKPKSIIRSAWENLEISICVATMGAMTIIIFAQVIGRYVFNSSLGWSEEVSRFLVVWITFGGSAYAFRRGAHIGVTALVNLLPKKAYFIITIFVRIVTIAFFLLLSYYGWKFTAQQISLHRVATATRLPMAIPYSAVPIGSILVIIRLLDQTIRELRLGRQLEVEEI